MMATASQSVVQVESDSSDHEDSVCSGTEGESQETSTEDSSDKDSDSNSDSFEETEDFSSSDTE